LEGRGKGRAVLTSGKSKQHLPQIPTGRRRDSGTKGVEKEQEGGDGFWATDFEGGVITQTRKQGGNIALMILKVRRRRKTWSSRAIQKKEEIGKRIGGERTKGQEKKRVQGGKSRSL